MDEFRTKACSDLKTAEILQIPVDFIILAEDLYFICTHFNILLNRKFCAKRCSGFRVQGFRV